MAVRERKFFVGGNWKMNGSIATIDKILSNIKEGTISPDTDVVVAPPACYLSYVKERLPISVEVSAQNCYKVGKGAFTGEISPDMLKDLGVEWTIIGHSERRHIFGESNKLVGEKVAYAIECGLKVIACIGEQLADRESGQTEVVVHEQLQAIVENITNWSNIIIAYEPVWAIGTGLSATPEQAQSVHAYLRKCLQVTSDVVASQTRIIYGGSVNVSNCKDLASMPDIDGFLVGGASLKPDFIHIINARE